MIPTEIALGHRRVGSAHPPLVIAEIGINHAGDFEKALRLIDAAAAAGCECVKFQTHIAPEEMIRSDLRPGNAGESLWEIIERCSLTEDEERRLKEYAESRSMLFLSTPFSLAAVDRLERLGVKAFKVGSGECNHYPLIEYVARIGKPMLVSTGMTSLDEIRKTVEIIRAHRVPFALLHCTSIYPTPEEKIRLGALAELAAEFPDAVIGLSDHSRSIYPALASVALGASLVEKHFTVSKDWEGPDIAVSMDPRELGALVEGSRSIHRALGGTKSVLEEEIPVMRFAHASVTALRDIAESEPFTTQNIALKRPGLGELFAADYDTTLGRRARCRILKDEQLKRHHVSE